ncbi:MAG: hypothetical protein JSU83_12455 [Deltaproteobacteria bacterium]|nr:MAG: hypothetical protein JSU83_12455 [Deltaproteobacteria bacterium]
MNERLSEYLDGKGFKIVSEKGLNVDCPDFLPPESAYKVAKLCVEANYNRWNPRHTTFDDFLDMFRKVY